jgi:hypothetical protein
MNNYLDQLAIESFNLPVKMTLEPIVENGVPNVELLINQQQLYAGPIQESVSVDIAMPLTQKLNVKLLMSNKQYNQNLETAVVVKSFSIDGHELVGVHDCLECISYQTDQAVDYRGFYLGFNGVWRFDLDSPFYQWWHIATGQGWLLEPAPVTVI